MLKVFEPVWWDGKYIGGINENMVFKDNINAKSSI